MSVRSGQSIAVTFTTQNPSTGAAANADSTPTGTVYKNGTADAATVTVTNVATGLYKAAVSLPGLSIGDVVELSIAATVNGVAGKGTVWRDTCDIAVSALGNVTVGGYGVNQDPGTQILDAFAAGGNPDTIQDAIYQTFVATSKIGTPANASIAADIAAVKTDTGTLLTRITSTLFAGITSLAKWLGAGMGKTADTATRAEINATTAGATYNETTDSQEAIRDRGDVAWVTGAGGGSGGASASDIADALAARVPVIVNATVAGGLIEIIRKDSYKNSEGTGRTLPFTKTATETAWPDTITTAHFSCVPTAETLEDSPSAASLSNVAMTVNTATGSGQQVSLELTSAQTGTLQAGLIHTGGYRWWIIANKDTEPATLRSGTMTVRPDPTA